jgi:hypothetical protein
MLRRAEGGFLSLLNRAFFSFYLSTASIVSLMWRVSLSTRIWNRWQSSMERSH